MEAMFEAIRSVTLSGSMIILVVLALRLVLQKTPRWCLCLLWLLAFLRLILPFSVESPLSLQPQISVPAVQAAPTIPDEPVSALPPEATVPQANSNVTVRDDAVTQPALTVTNPFDPLPLLWTIGACGCLGYAMISYVLLKQKVKHSVQLDKNIYESAAIDAPFLLGYLRPRIYLPVGLPPQDIDHILAHEQTHLRRLDHWTKLLGFVALSLHWFNPLVWVAYGMLCRDIETACDEAVVSRMTVDDRKAYSGALLRCATGHRLSFACPVAFGEVSVKQRIPKVLNYRKPAFWISLTAVIALLFVAVCFLTDPVSDNDPNAEILEFCQNALNEFHALESYSAQQFFETNDEQVLNRQPTTLSVFVRGEDRLRIHTPTDVTVYYLEKDGQQFIKYVTTAVSAEELAYPDWTKTSFEDRFPGPPELWLNDFQWDASKIHFVSDTRSDNGSGQRTICLMVDKETLQVYCQLRFVFDSLDNLISVIKEITWTSATGSPRYARHTLIIYADQADSIGSYIDSFYEDAIQ